jgi:hypothetical protein
MQSVKKGPTNTRQTCKRKRRPQVEKILRRVSGLAKSCCSMIGKLHRAVEDKVEDQPKDKPRKVSHDHLVSHYFPETLADQKLELEGMPQGPNPRQGPSPQQETNPQQQIMHQPKHHPHLPQPSTNSPNLPMPISKDSNSTSSPKRVPLPPNRIRSLLHSWLARTIPNLHKDSITFDSKVSILENGFRWYPPTGPCTECQTKS